MGIEPKAQAWEAWVLPLYDARAWADSSRLCEGQAIRSAKPSDPPSETAKREPFGLPLLTSAVLEVVVGRYHVRPADDTGEVQRRCRRKIGLGTGQSRERRLLVEDVVDDEPRREVLGRAERQRRIDQPPRPDAKIVLGRRRVLVVEIDAS